MKTQLQQTMKAKMNYLENAIAGWFENAKTDYGISGRLVSIEGDEEKELIIITVEEEGIKSECTLNYVSQFPAKELYNIWQESF